MAYTPATIFPASIAIGQWQTPDNPNPRLASPITSTDTTIEITAPFLNYAGTIITGNFLMGIKNAAGYVETIYVPAGAVSADGLTLTGVVRGVRLAGLDYTTAGTDLAADFEQDSAVYSNISAILFQMMIGAMTGTLASGGTSWKIGDGTDSNVTVQAYNADVTKPFFQYDAATNQWVYSNDGVSSTPFGTGAGLAGGAGITISGGSVDVDLTDTTVFVSTSAGVGDAGKAPRLDASGKIDASMLDDSDISVGNLQTNLTYDDTVTAGDALYFKGNGRVAKSDADAVDTTFPYAGIAIESGVQGESKIVGTVGPVVTIPTLTLTDGRLVTGQSNSTSNTTSDLLTAATQWRAQTFTPGAGETNVKSVTLNFTKTGSPTGNITAHIYATTGGVPSGASLGNIAVAYSSIATGDNVFTFASPVTGLSAGTVYAIVIDPGAGVSGGNGIAWNYQNTSVYASGQRCTSSDSGANWSAASTNDMRFTVQYLTVEGCNVYLSGTAGALTLSPGTYNFPVGVAQSLTTMQLKSGPKSIYVTYNFAASSSDVTVDTELQIGFRARQVHAIVVSISANLVSVSNGFWHQGLSGGISWTQTYTAAASNLTNSTASAIGYVRYSYSALGETTLSVQAVSQNSITIRRVQNDDANDAPGATVYLIIQE